MNKKIKNATITEYNGITFKSKMELRVYKELLQNGFTPEYESETFTLFSSFKPHHSRCFLPTKDGSLKESTNVVRSITYTPDFIIRFKGKIRAVIEVKGMPNDTYPLKRKLFRKYMEECSYPIVFFEIHTIKQLKIAIETMLKW